MKTISAKDAQRIIDASHNSTKHSLVDCWAKAIVLGKEIKITDETYQWLRERMLSSDLLDKIFGKEFPAAGTPCLVSTLNVCWSLRYSDGKDGFYDNGKKYGSVTKWDYWQILDINNLPVNE